MIGNSGGLINGMSLDGFLDCASVCTKSVAEMSFCFSYILHIAFGALYHVYEIGRRTSDVMSYLSLFICREKGVRRGSPP